MNKVVFIHHNTDKTLYVQCNSDFAMRLQFRERNIHITIQNCIRKGILLSTPVMVFDRFPPLEKYASEEQWITAIEIRFLPKIHHCSPFRIAGALLRALLKAIHAKIGCSQRS